MWVEENCKECFDGRLGSPDSHAICPLCGGQGTVLRERMAIIKGQPA